MGMLNSGAYQSAVKSVQKRYSDANMELGDRITKQQNQRDKYIKDHDNVEHVIYIMSDNMGLTYNEVSDLVLIYEDEIKAYVANYPSK